MDPLAKHYKNVVSRTWNFSGRVETPKDDIMNAVLGFGGEAGEVVDIHKKMLYHNPKDRYIEDLKLELGDVCYYMSKILNIYGWTLEEILEANKEKLFERHGIEE